MKVVRMQSISRQAGSVGSHQAQKEKWSILYRRHPGMGPSLDWAGARRGYTSLAKPAVGPSKHSVQDALGGPGGIAFASFG
jgi:hypothetical protein